MQTIVVIAVAIKLVFGSAYYFLKNVMAKTCGYSFYDIPEGFQPDSKCPPGMSIFKKPAFVSFLVFACMSISLIIFAIWRRKKCDPSSYSWRAVLLLAGPSVLECIAFFMGIYAQIIMALSLAMIMKGAKVVFSALFTITLLRRPLKPFHWCSVALCLVGIGLAWLSETLNEWDAKGTVLLGVSLQLASEVLLAFRVVFEELMMKKRSADPTFVVGWEGVYSTLILGPALFILWLAIPGKQGGSFENLPDTFYRIGESPVILSIVLLMPLIVILAAVAGALVTKYLSAVENSLISVSRCALIWGLELSIYYLAPDSVADQYGVKWGEYTWLKLMGFFLVIFSGFMYSGIIKLPRIFNYTETEQLENK
jgi:hypothetical protein